ncbi:MULTISPECIES: hypothetical protein [Nocardiaceae]|jgi:hypothetical protein|nr:MULTISPECIES: hypothetical protein [Rhodococcus]
MSIKPSNKIELSELLGLLALLSTGSSDSGSSEATIPGTPPVS